MKNAASDALFPISISCELKRRLVWFPRISTLFRVLAKTHIDPSVRLAEPTRQIYDAFYRLTDPQAQIRSYVFDVVRSELGLLLCVLSFKNGT